MTTETSPLNRQPTALDYSSPTQFRFLINQLPKVQYFTTEANIPGITLSDVELGSPLKNIPMLGDKLTYEDLAISFIVDENLENYIEMHTWLTSIGFPKDRKQFRDFRSNTSNTPSASINTPSTERVGATTPANALFSDANLIVLSNKNNPLLQVDYQNIYPVALSGIQFSQDGADVQYITSTATFSYQIYEFTTL